MFTPVFLRRTAIVVLVTFTNLTMLPVQAAVQAQRLKAAQSASSVPAAPMTEAQKRAERLSNALSDVDSILKEVGPQTQVVQPPKAKKGKRAKRGKPAKGKTRTVLKPLPGVNVRAQVKQLRAKHQEIAALEGQAEQDFAATEKHLKDAKLPQVILDRQHAALTKFRNRRAEFDRLMADVEKADDTDQAALPTKLKALSDFMDKHPNHKVRPPADPNKMPFGKDSDKVRAPKTSKGQYLATLFKSKPVMLAGPIPNGFTMPTTTLPYTPTADDLAPTEDIVLTSAIQAQAAALNNNPVQIYNWVRNNIEYIPSYGSIQGADMTLQTKRGNDMDTASLLIALYRAAGIPARYVYGTVMLPADKVMNWVGGVTTPEAALNLMGQGGIPSVGMVSGGAIRYIELEHVWVEAYVDYTPSRGATNKHPDTWVVMDPSYKQYTYTQGMNIQANVPFDAQSVASQAQTGATLDPSGWVQNINASAVQSALTTYQSQVQTYITTTKPNATVGDVIGAKTIIAENQPILMGTLPYKIVATGAELNALPLFVRHQFEYDLYASAADQAMGNAAFSYRISLPALAGKKVTLSFAPASQADADTIASYIPTGTNVLASQLPTSLPAYLIHLNAELRIDGQAVAVGGPFTMGDTLVGTQGLYDPVYGWRYADDTSPTAGEYIATHVDLQGVSSTQLQVLKARIAATQAQLQAQQFAGLTKEDIVGDTLYSGILTYFSEDYSTSLVVQRAMGTVDYRKPSFGNFETSAMPVYWFGIPTALAFSGFIMDVNRYVSMNVGKDNSSTLAVAYNKQVGMAYSANEHLVPEQLFGDPATPNQQQGVSAVKALTLASLQGQKIYTLNASNQASQSTLLSQVTIDPAAMAEIQNALAAGKEVTVHQAPITVNGWTGSGYIITDPGAGTGAYKLSGGFNGGALKIVGDNSTPLGFAFFVLGLIAGAGALEVLAGSALAVGPLVIGLVAVSAFVISMIAIWAAETDALANAGCAQAISCIQHITSLIFAVNLALAVLALFAYPAAAIALGVLGLIYGDSLIGAATRGCNASCT